MARITKDSVGMVVYGPLEVSRIGRPVQSFDLLTFAQPFPKSAHWMVAWEVVYAVPKLISPWPRREMARRVLVFANSVSSLEGIPFGVDYQVSIIALSPNSPKSPIGVPKGNAYLLMVLPCSTWTWSLP